MRFVAWPLAGMMMVGLVGAGWGAPPQGTGPVLQFGTTVGTAASGIDRRLNGSVFWAPSYGSCVWDVSHDTGPCIVLAQAAAVAAGGGTIALPAGDYGLGTALVQTSSRVHFQGGGIGIARDTINPNNYLAATRIVWIGAAGATMLDVEPVGTPSTTQSLFSADVTGIVFDCNSIAAICVKISQVSSSQLFFSVAEPTSIGAWFTTQAITDAPGNQNNDIWIDARATNSANSPTDILLDGGVGSSWNTSYNRIHSLSARFNRGDGIVLGNADNNVIDVSKTTAVSGATGRGFVFASSNYTMPNGLTTAGPGYNNRVSHNGSTVIAQGFSEGTTYTPSISNTGTAIVTNKIASTTAVGSSSSKILAFSSTTGIATGMMVNCGGTASGILTGDTVSSVSGLNVTLTTAPIGAVPSGTTCSFGPGIIASAVTGTYTLTATGAATFNLTAPTGGNSQTGVTLSGGTLAFTDMVLPISGTPATSDTWTIVTPRPAVDNLIEWTDRANSVPDPMFEPGASGSYSNSQQVLPNRSGYTSGLLLGTGSATNNCIVIGYGNNNCSGTNAAIVGGSGNTVSGFAGNASGQNNTVAASNSMAVGFNNQTPSAANDSFAVGGNILTRGTGQVCSGNSASLGLEQACSIPFRGTGATATAIRLTGDGAAAGSANCGNIPSGTSFAITIALKAIDKTTPTNSFVARWSAAHSLDRAGAASTTLIDGSTAAIAPDTTKVIGTVTPTASVMPDTTNGCLNLSFTPPTGNTDTWDVSARAETVEAQ